LKQKPRHKKLKSTRFDEPQRSVNLGYRKVLKNKNSKIMYLPKIWVDSNGIEVGDKVEVIMEPNGTLSVRKLRRKACPK